MRFSSAAAAAALVAGATASYGNYGYGYGNSTETPVYTTEVVTAYTTYCPGPTQITYGTQTYTVTEATTLTITNCPCTVTYPVTSSTYAPPPTTYTPPPYPTSTPVYTPTYQPSSPPVYTPTGSPVPTGAANKAVAASGAGLAAVLGFVAYVL